LARSNNEQFNQLYNNTKLTDTSNKDKHKTITLSIITTICVPNAVKSGSNQLNMSIKIPSNSILIRVPISGHFLNTAAAAIIMANPEMIPQLPIV